MFALLIRYEGREQRKTFSSGSATLGRRTGNDVQITDSSVSKEHARIEERRKGCIIMDLESANGTYVNGERIVKQLLKDRDVIRVGDTEIVFVQRASGDMEEEIERAAVAMNQGVGYETMLARITKDQKELDMAAIRGMAEEEDTAHLETLFQEMGWSPVDAQHLAREARGRPIGEISEVLVVSVQRPKGNELLVECSGRVQDIESGNLVRFKGAEYLVVEIHGIDTGCNYRLKRC